MGNPAVRRELGCTLDPSPKDFDAAGRLLGVEILGCRAVLPPELLRSD